MKSPVALEEDLFERLATRAAEKNEYDSHEGWEDWVLMHWPHKLTIEYWWWLFKDLGDIPWINLWSPLTDLYEMKWFIINSKRWRWSWLWEETKPERILCRLRGHPKGMIYYNPGGFEPDGRCQTCGENIG